MVESFIKDKQIIAAAKRLLESNAFISEDCAQDVFFVFMSQLSRWAFEEAIKCCGDSDAHPNILCLGLEDDEVVEDDCMAMHEKKRNYCTGEYIFKQLSFDFLNGRKKIILVNDSITDERNFLRYYAEISKRLDDIYGDNEKPQIIPMVLAASVDFASMGFSLSKRDLKDDIFKSYESSELMKAIENIQDNLIYEFIFDTEYMARFNIEGTKILQKNLSPLIMDFPVYDSLLNSNGDNKYEEYMEPIHFTFKEFKDLCLSKNKWKYVKNSFEIHNQEICCDYFVYDDYLLQQKLGNLFLNFVIKMKYNKTDEGVDVVFTPLAMARSCSFSDIWKSFEVLFKDTLYYKQVVEYLENKIKSVDGDVNDTSYEDALNEKIKYGIDDNLYHGTYTAILSSINMYLMRCFSKKINAVGNINVKCNKKYILESNGYDFVESVYESVYGPDGTQTLDYYNDKIVHMKNDKGFSKVITVANNQELCQGVEYTIRDLITQRKVRIEEIEEIINSRFSFETLSQGNAYLTRAIILLLELGCVDNEPHINSNKNIIYCSYRQGNNSGSLMPVGIEWVFPYIFALYYYKDEDFFREQISDFSVWLYDKFLDNDYFQNYVSEDKFYFIFNHFKNTDVNRLNNQIINKVHYLDVFRENGEENPVYYWMDRAFAETEKWCKNVDSKCKVKI